MEFTALTKFFGSILIVFIVYKTEIYKPIIKKVSGWINFIFGFGSRSFADLKIDKARSKSINKMIKRSKYKGEL